MLSAKATIFSYPKQNYLYFCIEVFKMRVLVFQLLFFPHLSGEIPQGPHNDQGVLCSDLKSLHNCEQNGTYLFFLILFM